MREQSDGTTGRMRSGHHRLTTAAALALFAAVIIRTAWLSDDAYITFRVVENAVAGLGLTWNPAERVQAYTHPLWLFVLLAGRLVTGELYYTTIWLSIALSIAAVLLLIRRHQPLAAAFAITALAFSRAFVDFSTSGLENALSHLLLAGFVAVWFGRAPDDRRLFLLALLAALLATSRLDALLLVAPALALALWQRRSPRALLLLALGLLPVLVWTGFSVLYYGFPFPNTAYAKLATGIAAADLARQGVAYLQNSLRWDPLTLVVIVVSLAAAAVARRHRPVAVAAGIALYLLYTVRIGGDFMSGRFLTLPLLAALALLLYLWPAAWRGRALAVGFGLLGLLALLGHVPVWLAGNPTGDAARRDGDIADERAYYTPHTGLFSSRVLHPWAEQGISLYEMGPAVVEHGNVGFLGFYAGPAVHIVDRNALTDPLLARLPVRNPADWRVGHFRRSVPAGYVATLRDGVNVIEDAGLAAYYEPLRLVTRGQLWERERLAALWRLNAGAYDYLLPATWP